MHVQGQLGVFLSIAGVWQVHLLARGEKLRASRAMQDRVLNHDKVTVHFNTTVDDAYPDGKGALAGLHTKDTKSGQGSLHSLCSHSSALQHCVAILFIHCRLTYMLDMSCHICSLGLQPFIWNLYWCVSVFPHLHFVTSCNC